MNFQIKKATKKGIRLRLALIGPTGSGKTYSALKIATALGKKIAVIDTEHGSASKYADKFDFDVIELTSYHPGNYIEAIEHLDKHGYDVIIIDSTSHAWDGKDGALELKDRKSKDGNSFTAWADITPLQHRFIEAQLASRAHIIATMRAKQEYVLETNARGKQVPRKVGMGAVQRSGVDYEYDIVGHLDEEHAMRIEKTRCEALDGKVFLRPGEKFVEELLPWLGTMEPEPVNGAKPAAPATQANAQPDAPTLPPRKETKPTAKELGDWIKEQRAKLPTEDSGECKQITRRLAEFGVSASDAPTRTGEIALLIGDAGKLAEFRTAVLADVAAWAELQNEGAREAVA